MSKLKRRASTKPLRNSESHSDRSHVASSSQSSQKESPANVNSSTHSCGRKDSSQDPATIIIVCTEGENTEPRYLDVFKKIYVTPFVPKSRFNLTVISNAGVPMTVVDRAIEKLQGLSGSLGNNDSVWAMFDRDVHPHFDEAKCKARKKGVHLAVSNPCFELWGIYHYQDYHQPGDRSKYHHECQRKLRELCKSYKESGNSKLFLDEDIIKNKYPDAVNRAKKSLISREEEGNPEGGPSTSVHLLTEEILATVDRILN